MNQRDTAPDLFQRAMLAVREAQRLRDDLERAARMVSLGPEPPRRRQSGQAAEIDDPRCPAARRALQIILEELDTRSGLAEVVPPPLARSLIERATIACFYARVGDPRSVRAELRTLLAIAQTLPLEGAGKRAALRLRRRLRLALAATPRVPYRGACSHTGGQSTTS